MSCKLLKKNSKKAINQEFCVYEMSKKHGLLCFLRKVLKRLRIENVVILFCNNSFFINNTHLFIKVFINESKKIYKKVLFTFLFRTGRRPKTGQNTENALHNRRLK